MRFTSALAAIGATLLTSASAQQYAGDTIPNSLPGVPGSEITYFRIDDPSGKNNNLTLINYYSHGSDGKRLVPANIQRLVIVVHGANRDPGTYMSNMLSALSQVQGDKNIGFDKVAIMAPYFPNGDDKTTGYPWTAGLSPGYGSTSNALVWSGSEWSAGGNNQYPRTSKNTSSYSVLDQVTQYFDNASLFPNMKQIVISGHSLGAQTVERYAAIGSQLNTRTPVSYWVGNPNSLAWLSTSRPLNHDDCASYDMYREGYANFSDYPMTYGRPLVKAGRSAIVANLQSKAINWARGIRDMGDDSSSCAPESQGSNRNERFFNFIKSWPPACSNPNSNACDTVDFINTGHDAGAMFASLAGQARLFVDNFYGDGNRSYDFGYPRYQSGDDPYPNPALVNTPQPVANNTGTYAGGMTYAGCYSDQTPQSLTKQIYTGNSNSIEYCTSLCASSGYTIAGLEFGTQCFCGNSLGYKATKVIDMSCSTTCPGNSSENCGGSNRLSVFSAGTPNVQVQPVVPATIGAFSYLGCYTEATSGRALSGSGTSGNSVSLDSCATYCAGSKYFGVEYGDECYCGNTLGAGANLTAAGDCNMLCAANTTEWCGAGNRLTTYQNLNYTAGASSTTSAGGSTPTGGAPTGSTLTCPGSNGVTYTSNGKNFTVECGIDHAGGDLSSLSVSGLNQCIDTCATTAGCVDVSLSGSACYLKSTLGASVTNSGIWGGRLLTGSNSDSSSSSSSGSVSGSATSTSTSTSSAPSSTGSTISCPASNGQTYVSNGQSFTIECGIDHAGGDMSSLSVSNFNQCVDTCATTTGCVDVSLSGSACYLKSTLGASVTSSGIWGAKLLTGSSSISSSSASSSSVSSSSVSSSAGAPATSAVTSTSTSASTTSSTTSSGVPTGSAISCPASNSTTYTAANGATFIVECGIDHAGGDMSSLSVSGLGQCIEACAQATGCVDVSLSGSACYLKSRLGAAVYGGVNGGRLVSSAQTAASTSSGTSSSASSLAQTSSNGPSSSVTSTSTSSSSTLTSTSSTTSSSASSTGALSSSSSSVVATSTDSSSSLLSSSSSLVSSSSSTGTGTSSTSFVASTTLISSVSSSTSSLTTSSSSTSSSSATSTLTSPSSTSSSVTSASSTPSPTSSQTSSSSSSSTDSTTLSSSTSSTSSASSASSSSSSSVSSTSSASTTSSSSSSSVSSTSSASTTSSSSSSSVSSTSSASPTSSSSSSSVSSTSSASPTSSSSSSSVSSTSSASTTSSSPSSSDSSTSSASSTSSSASSSTSAASASSTSTSVSSTSSSSVSSTSVSSTSSATVTSSVSSSTSQTSTSTSSSASSTASLTVVKSHSNWSLQGCYVDNGQTAMDNLLTMSNSGGHLNATVDNCLNDCKAHGYTYCGLEYYSECYGTNATVNGVLASGSSTLTQGCNYACRGNSSQACGGNNRMMVYLYSA